MPDASPESTDAEPLFRIGEAAELTRLSVRTLRHWDQVGLVVPHGRSDGGYRLYTPTDVERLRIVRFMKPLDLSVEEMRGLLDNREALLQAGDGQAGERDQAAQRLRPLLERADYRARRLTEQLQEVMAFSARLTLELDSGVPALSQRLPVAPVID